uniref:ADP-ribosylation factor-like protein 2-binding protein n=1 Tax=Theropithecus gelada TaxID=9565 RepID=A0A8D2EL99_THEGE
MAPTEESFALPISSASEAKFDAVIGSIEAIIMDLEFQVPKRNFMDKYYQEFEDTEENKLTYTPIFNEYLSLVEKYIEEQLLERIPEFNMATFTATLEHHKDEVADDIFDTLVTFTNLLAFKEMFLEYRAEKEGRGLDLSGDLVVTSLCKNTFHTSYPKQSVALARVSRQWEPSGHHGPSRRGEVSVPNDRICLGKTDSAALL